MKSLLFILVFWCSAVTAQETFAKIYDREETRTGRQLKRYGDRYFALVTGVCIGAGECCEVMEIDPSGNIIWSKRLPWIDPSSRSLLVNNDTITISGNHNPQQTEFYLHQMSVDGGDSLDTHIIDDDRIDLQEMYQLSTIEYNGQYIIAGAARLTDTAYAIMFRVDKSGVVDTLFIADQNNLDTDIWDVFEDVNGNLVAIFKTKFLNNTNFSVIKKYNKDLDEVWSYTSESIFINLSIPKGTELDDGRIAMVFGNPDGKHELHSIRVINPDSTVSWQYDWTHLDNQARYIYDIETANDGSIFAMGSYSHFDFPLPYVSKAPFIIKLSPDGEKIWERAYLEFGENGENKNGLIYDLEELDDGSILAIGQQYNQNGDILIMRLDAEGCLMDGCGQNVEFTDVEDLIHEEILIYPNPVSDLLHIEADIQLRQMILRDITGQVHYSGVYRSSLDMSEYPRGMYLLTLISDKGLYVHRKVLRK